MSKRVDSKLEGLHYEMLQEWVHSGKESSLDPEMKTYLDQLDMVRGLIYSLNEKTKIIKVLMHTYKDLTYAAAETRYYDAIEFFYVDKPIKKEACTAILVQDATRCYQAIIKTATEPKHFSEALKGIQVVANLLGLDKDEPEPLPDHLLEEKVPILVMDPKKLKLPDTDRNKLAEQIKNFKITEKQKEKIKQESGVKPFELLPDNE